MAQCLIQLFFIFLIVFEKSINFWQHIQLVLLGFFSTTQKILSLENLTRLLLREGLVSGCIVVDQKGVWGKEEKNAIKYYKFGGWFY